MTLSLMDILRRAPVIPVIVIHDLATAVPLADALVAGGLPVLEVTLRTPAGLAAIAAMRRAVPEAIVGVGTLSSPEQFQSVTDAGAQFGVSPGLTAEMAAAAKAEGKTIFDTLDELYLRHGLHASDQLSIRVADLGLLDAMMNRLRVSPPEAFGSSAVESFVDLAEGSGQLPPTDGLLYLTRDQTRVIIRPSGTEPKLKCYLEVLHPVESAAELPEARQAARLALDAVISDVREALGL